MDIVYLKSVDEGFWQKIDAFVDIGFDMTKANNIMTLSTRSGIEYMAPVWSLGLTFNINFTTQDDDTQRITALIISVIQNSEWSVNFSFTI